MTWHGREKQGCQWDMGANSDVDYAIVIQCWLYQADRHFIDPEVFNVMCKLDRKLCKQNAAVAKQLHI